MCFVHSTKVGLDIWFLKKKGDCISSDMNEQDDYDSLNWIKEFSIPIGPEAEPCALTNGGEVLLAGQAILFCYNPQTNSLNTIAGNYFQHGFRYVIPHMNSFVSLKALGEKCKIRQRYDVNPAPREIFIEPQREDRYRRH